MTDCGNDWNRAGKNCTGNRLKIERPQILNRATAPANDDDINRRQAKLFCHISPTQGSGDCESTDEFIYGSVTLNQHANDRSSQSGPTVGNQSLHIGKSSRPSTRNYGDVFGHAWKGHTRAVKRPFMFESLNQSPLRLFKNTNGLHGFYLTHNQLKITSLGPKVQTSNDNYIASFFDGRVNAKSCISPNDTVQLAVIISQFEVDGSVVYLPLRDFPSESLMLE
jgi:hypothetical protein